MKKTTLLVAVLALLSGLAVAAPRNHLMGVERLPGWNPEYLTVTWSGTIGYQKTSSETARYIVSLVDRPSRLDEGRFSRFASPSIKIGSYVVSIDGRDAKGWNAEDFYAVLDQPRRHILVLGHPFLNETYEVQCDGELPVWMTAQGFHPLTCKWTRTSYNKMSDRFKIRKDRNADWSKFKTYDWYISGNDVLADKELLERIARNFEDAGMKRDEEHPDIVFTVVKDAHQSIDYTYVPETVEHVQTGTKSQAVYGWKGKYLGSVSSNQYETVKSGGYTQKTASTSAYLEVNILEASRLGEKVAPLIWQLKYHYNENTQADVDQLYEAAVSWADHPIKDYNLEMTSDTHTRMFYGSISLVNVGVILDARSEVVGLDPNSSLVRKSGLKTGDVLKGIDVTKSESLAAHHRTSYSGKLTVERDGRQLTLPFSGCTPVNSLKPVTYFTAYTSF